MNTVVIDVSKSSKESEEGCRWLVEEVTGGFTCGARGGACNNAVVQLSVNAVVVASVVAWVATRVENKAI